MERWIKGIILTLILTAMVVSNKFISLGSIHMFLFFGEMIFLVFAVVRLSGYTREELGLGGEFHPIKHVLFPFVFFVFPLTAVPFVPHNAMPFWKFLLYFLNYLLIAGLIEELLFRGLLFASLEEGFGEWAALIGNSVIHWLAHFAVGLNISQLIAALILSSYRLAFRRIEPLIVVHGLWDAVFIALNPKLLGGWDIMFPLLGAFFSILLLYFIINNYQKFQNKRECL